MALNNHAVDLGYGNNKGRRWNRTTINRSILGNFIPKKSDDIEDQRRIAIEFGNEKFLYGNTAAKHSTTLRATLTEDRAYSPEGLKLLMATLIELTDDSPAEHLNLMLGLPILWCQDNKEKYIKAVTGLHNVSVYDLSDKFLYRKYFSISENRVEVISQPIANVYNILLDNNGQWIPEKKHLAMKKIGVVNIGYNTTEVVVIDALEHLSARTTSFPKSGMVTVYNSLAQVIREDLKVNLPVEKMEKYFQDGFINVNGKTHSLESHKKAAIQIAADNIYSKIISAWEYTWDLDYICLAGGTALHLSEHLLSRLGEQAELDPDPVMAVVNGLYKYAQRIWK